MRTLSTELVKTGKLPAATANTSDLITTICDMGDCDSVTAIVNFEFTTDAIIELAFWTSASDAFIASGTPRTATTNTVQVEITSDADGLQAWNGNTQVTDLTVASNMISSLAQDCTVAVALPNTRRYVAAQYTGLGTGSTLGIVFVGHGSGSGGLGTRAAY